MRLQSHAVMDLFHAIQQFRARTGAHKRTAFAAGGAYQSVEGIELTPEKSKVFEGPGQTGNRVHVRSPEHVWTHHATLGEAAQQESDIS